MPNKIPFRVTHVSGQDENYKALELNTHSPTTKGWQSSRFCLYPQDIVIQLENRSRLRKIQILSHQFLLATKIEFYVGDVPDGIPMSLQNARYTRLGYVALSDNDKTGYKARELKSVHVDANGVFVKFVIHKNHVNRHNLYNQVGLIALNIIGDDLNKNPDISDDREQTDDPALVGFYNRPDFISPLDDLAFDMYQDPEVAQIIRRLENKKQEAVLQERYDYAKKIKNATAELQKVGEKLGKYEVEKRQAVENEDYDKAKLKKVQMDEYRLQVYKQLELYDLLEMSGSRHNQQVDLDSSRLPTPPRLDGIGISPLPDSGRLSTPPSNRTPYDERPLPAIKKNPQGDDDTEDTSGTVTGEPEPMIEKDQREAGVVIDTYGLPLASKCYSKTWSFREDALLDVYKQISELPTSTPKDEVRNHLRAAAFMINRAIKDKVHAVYTAGLNLLKMVLTELVPSHRIGKTDIVYIIEKTLPNLLLKIGDTGPRNRDTAKNFILDESNFPEVKPLHVVPVECVKPFKLNIAPRLALSRVEVVDTLYRDHGLDNSGLTADNIMKFCVQAIEHHAGEVREKAERIIVRLYKQSKDTVRANLPSDDDRSRKIVLYKQLFEAFDRIDGKPSKEDIRKRDQESELAKQKEIEDLQTQLQALKDMAAGKAGAKEKPKPKVNSKTEPQKSSRPKAEDAATLGINHTCIFCGEKNEEFTEEGLDLHYWKSCPMLKRCSYCKQVVEIAGYTDHLLTECESKEQFKKCVRCSEAIIAPEYEQHVSDKTCSVAESSKSHCPLCHNNITLGEDEWKDHLMGGSGCRQNPRRLQALNKQGKSGSQLPKGAPKSKVPTRNTAQGKTPRK